jgi:hypothetical protein
VNIGIDAFTPVGSFRPDAGHLERFATLVTFNQRWSVRMAQRTHESARWARFERFATQEQRRDWAANIARFGYCSQSHTDVLNASHEGRVEFRLPRGTLRIDRFYAKLEWAAAMVEYSRNAENVMRPSEFMRWVAANETEYPALLGMMRERFNAGRFGEVA